MIPSLFWECGLVTLYCGYVVSETPLGWCETVSNHNRNDYKCYFYFKTEILKAEFERLTARQPMEVLSMKR